MIEIKNVREENVEVASFAGVDISDLKIAIIAVYAHPEDYPNKCVARIYDVDRATNTVLVRDNVPEIREDIAQAFPDKVRFPRGAEDVKSLVEAWL